MTSSERPSLETTSEKRGPHSRTEGREFWKCSGSLKCLELSGLRDPSRTLEGTSRKCSESVSRVFPEFFWNFLREVPAVLGIGPKTSFFTIRADVSRHFLRFSRSFPRTPLTRPREQAQRSLVTSWRARPSRITIPKQYLPLVWSKVEGFAGQLSGGVLPTLAFSEFRFPPIPVSNSLSSFQCGQILGTT